MTFPLNKRIDDAAPMISAAAVTPSDATNIVTPGPDPNVPTRAILCSAVGTVSLLMADGTTAAFTAVAGVLYNLSVKRVNATGTTATGIVAFW